MREPHVFALQYFAIMAWKSKEKQANAMNQASCPHLAATVPGTPIRSIQSDRHGCLRLSGWHSVQARWVNPKNPNRSLALTNDPLPYL
jgi:hypothetical protein